MPRVKIRLLETIEECRQCDRIQMNTWGGLSVAGEVLYVTQKYGGTVVGTIVDGRVVGFIYAFLARCRGQLVHWSHMMAVESKFRDRGFGFRMKLVHRQVALDAGIKSICWTFDPLQSRNARLNIAHLGGVANEYIPDCYGHFPTLLEKDLLSDRLVVDWRIGTTRVKERLSGKAPGFDPSLPRANQTQLTATGLPKNRAIRLGLRDSRLLVEVPARTDEMRSTDLPLGRRWRLDVRRILTHYISAGYRVDDFFAPQPATQDRCFYLLRRNGRG